MSTRLAVPVRRRARCLLVAFVVGLALLAPAAAPAGAVVAVEQVATGNSPLGVAVDPATGRVFVADAGSANVTVLDGRANPPDPIAGSPVAAGPGPPRHA